MVTGSIPKRYAKAITMIALERGVLDELFEESRRLEASLASSAELALLMEGEMSRKERVRLLKGVFPALGFSPFLTNFVTFLALKKRTDIIRGILREFFRIYNDINNISPCEIISAIELPGDVKDRLKGIVSQMTGRTPDIEWKVKKEILSGIVIKMENNLYDLSLKRSLDILKERIRKNVAKGVTG